MQRRLVLRGQAVAEFEETIKRYEADRDGLGQGFRAIIEHYFGKIANNPELFRTIGGDVRCLVFSRRFPCVIHFRIEPNQIDILSVFHTSRDRNRLKFRK